MQVEVVHGHSHCLQPHTQSGQVRSGQLREIMICSNLREYLEQRALHGAQARGRQRGRARHVLHRALVHRQLACSPTHRRTDGHSERPLEHGRACEPTLLDAPPSRHLERVQDVEHVLAEGPVQQHVRLTHRHAW